MKDAIVEQSLTYAMRRAFNYFLVFQDKIIRFALHYITNYLIYNPNTIYLHVEHIE